MTPVRAELDGEFVVFLIGMRIRKPWAVHKWLPVFLAMGRMLRELTPADGLLSFERAFIGGPAVVQYWRSQEQLDAFAHGLMHKAAWRDWNRRIRDSGAVGIWHETYRVGSHESVYQHVERFGLVAASTAALRG